MFTSWLQEGWKGEPNNAPFSLLYETIMYSISVQIVVLLDTKGGMTCTAIVGDPFCAILHAITKYFI